MTSLTTYFSKALGKQSVREAVRAGGWKVLIDGNLAETAIEHGPGGELVGVDQFGNKYFEKKDAQMVRNRWVVYASAAEHWTEQESTTVPPEWHGWLHYITDENPTNTDFPKPIYAVEARRNPTMGPARYQPKGVWETPQQRNWQKYQAWAPPRSS